MIVDDLPTGHLTFFIINMLVSYFFSFVGFLLTYLLHTSHAAKYGSRAGLGLTLIQYGFISRGRASEDQQTSEGLQGTLYWNTTANPMVTPSAQPVPDLPYQNGTAPDALSVEGYDLTGRDWMAFLFMTLGQFILLCTTCNLSYLHVFQIVFDIFRLVLVTLINRGLLPRKTVGTFHPNDNRDTSKLRRSPSSRRDTPQHRASVLHPL